MDSNSEGFYITLPNDSSRDFFPENKPSEYTTKLPQWIELNGEWEIGLHSIAYTQWNIIQHLDDPISFTRPNGTNERGGKMKKYHATVHEYIENINKSLKDYVADEIKFNLQNGKVTITLSPGYKIHLRRGQAIVLGFMKLEDPSEVVEIERPETRMGMYEANLYRETNIYVYCNIAQPQIIGSKTAPLLGIVPCGKTMKTHETVYAVENIHYMPVQTKSFQEIKVLLRSSTNESIPFEYGRAVITLHLKPLNYFK